jgi:propanediol dehydratase small subunit
MNKIAITIISLLTVVGVVFWSIWDGGKLPMPFRGRTCQGRGWKKAFPDAQTKDIRDFLLFFVDAFAFSEKEKLKLNPDDRILEIYKTMYPSKWMADALEFETLVENLRQSYSVDLATIWNDNLTLGELFAVCIKITPNTPLEPSR